MEQKIVKGKIIRDHSEIVDGYRYLGCTFYISYLNCARSVFDNCSFRQDMRIYNRQKCCFINCSFSSTTVEMSYSNLEKIPSLWSSMPDLEKLLVGYNNIVMVESSFSNYRNLKYINLAYNRFRRFPMNILLCESLQGINLAGNRLTEIIDADYRHLDSIINSNIKYIDLSFNNIEKIPEWMFGLPNLKTIMAIGTNIDRGKAKAREIKRNGVEICFAGNIFTNDAWEN